jgi:ribosomal protein S12 methylthiotransferase
VPGIALRTTFIVGFPGETDAQFEELLQFIEETKFERLGVFQYSQEDHTPAGDMGEQIAPKIKKQRYRQAMATQQKVSRELHRQQVGKTLRVLVEKRTGDGWAGRSHADAPEIDGSVRGAGRVELGQFASVTVTGSSEYDLVAAG